MSDARYQTLAQSPGDFDFAAAVKYMEAFIMSSLGVPAYLLQPPPSTTFDALLDDICREPENWRLRSVLADWLEDEGRGEEAECVRWMARERKRACRQNDGCFEWFGVSGEGMLGDPASDVPVWLWDRLAGGHRTDWSMHNHKGYVRYATRRRAELAILAAWKKARREGVTPDEVAG